MRGLYRRVSRNLPLIRGFRLPMRRIAVSLLALIVALVCAGGAGAAPNIVGQVKEFDLGAGTRPEALVNGPDGNLWFAGIGFDGKEFTDVLGKVTPRGEATEYTINRHPANLGLSDIVSGPDGNLWFTVGGRPRVGKVTVDGQITEFTLPNLQASPMSMTVGPDGNLWFTEFQGGSVGRITPSGEITEFPLQEAGHIAAGPDGALWVTGATTISRVATDGKATTFPLPASIEYPNEIVAGPDGALWFGIQSRFGVGATPGLGRVDTAGQVSEIPVPGGRQTFALALGASGAIWYSNGGGRIGWIIPGVATGTPACINSCRAPISALAAGPDGKLWFAAGVEPGEPSSTPGTVGTYAPPPLEIRVVGNPVVEGRNVVVPVRCRWTPAGAGCEGHLRVLAAGKQVERPVKLRLGRRKQVDLRLPGKASRRLAQRGRLLLKATTTVTGGRRDTRRIVLRRP